MFTSQDQCKISVSEYKTAIEREEEAFFGRPDPKTDFENTSQREKPVE